MPPRTVGVVVDAALAHGRGLLKGITAYGLGAGWRYRRPGLWTVHKEPEIAKWRVDGIIAAAHTPSMCDVIKELAVPAVDVSGAPVDPSIPSVVCDDEAIGWLAASHLLDRGLLRLAFVGQHVRVWSRGRQNAFVKAAADAGIPCHVYKGDPLRPSARHRSGDTPAELRRWLRKLPLPCGVFAANDQIGEVILRAARDLRIMVPEQLAVIGADDDEMIAPLTSPPLSSIDLNTARIGVEAAKLLDELMGGAKPPSRTIRIPPARIVTRTSSDILAIPDQEVAAAVRFIRERDSVHISVADVIASVPLSRRPLEKRFRKRLRRSILQEIHRVHTERAKQLLGGTDQSMPAIARASGFLSATRLGIVFKRLTGMTPSAYREQYRR